MTTRPALTLDLASTTLAFFIDDTGDERYGDQSNPVLGLGGCAVVGQNYEALIREPWNNVRAACTGDSQRPLHARKFYHHAGRKRLQAIDAFFRQYPFMRFAAITHHKTTKPDELESMQLVCRALLGRIEKIARWQPFTDIALIFESAAERRNKQIEQCFQAISVVADGRTLPVQGYFMPKRSGNQGLEVADFIIHAVGQQTKQNLKQRGQLLPGYTAVFQSQDARLCDLIEVESATVS